MSTTKKLIPNGTKPCDVRNEINPKSLKNGRKEMEKNMRNSDIIPNENGTTPSEAVEVVNPELEKLVSYFVDGVFFDDYKINLSNFSSVLEKHNVKQVVISNRFDYLFVGRKPDVEAVIDYLDDECFFGCDDYEITFEVPDEEIIKAYNKCVKNNKNHIVLSKYKNPTNKSYINSKFYKAKLELDELLDSDDVDDRLTALTLLKYAVKKITYDYDDGIRLLTANEYLGLNEFVYDEDHFVKRQAEIHIEKIYNRLRDLD